MPKIKTHLKTVVRTDRLKGESRQGCLRLDMNESPFGLPEVFVRETLAKINTSFVCTYPEYFSLVEAIAKDNRIKPENICLSNGSDAAIKYIFDSYVSAGDKVLVTDPTFAMYKVYCRIFNAKCLTVPYNNDLSFPEDKFLKKLNKGVRMAVVVNPNNPAGSTIRREPLLKMIKKAERNHTLVIVDEAYYYFCPETMIREVGNFSNLVVLRTFSKLCGMAGLRIGFAAASPKVISSLKKVRPTYDVNSVAALFAEEALRKPRMLETLVSLTMAGKAMLISKLIASGIDFRDGEANFVLIKCPGCAIEVARSLRQERVLVGFGFEQPFLRDYIRVTLGDERTMLRFWKIFERTFKKHVKKSS